MQGHIYTLACCWRSTLPQADITRKHNITCHPPSVPTTLFIKGSRRDYLPATTETENSFVNFGRKLQILRVNQQDMVYAIRQHV